MIIGIACACSAGSAVAQNVLRADTVQNGYSRLRDYTARIINAIAPTSPDVFGTTAVSAGVTFYDARFRRVSLADRADPAVLAIAERLRGLTPDAQLATVQREVLRRVKWSHDLDNMHVADFWSNAGETLARGTGDSEDIAIVEMQALKAAGFNARDLYISIGRQKQVGAHIVLLARTPSGFTVLDDRTRVPIAAEDDRVFTPVLTVGEGKSWVHGHRIRSIVLQASALAERAMAPLSTSR
ncbi:MAG: transglutaminase-like cysteine peptidase [Sphingomicrobium sp.]